MNHGTYTFTQGHTIDAEARRYERIKKDLNGITQHLDKSKDSDIFEDIDALINKVNARYADELDQTEMFI